MKTRLLLSTFLALTFTMRLAFAANEVGFIEKFALAPDREAVLKQLVPGSEEFYFFHALHFQNSGQKPKLKTTMEEWAVRFPNSEQRKVIENREALLGYDADPQATLQFLRNRLELQFNHQQEVRDKKPDLPTTLDPAKIGREIFQREAFQNPDNLDGFSEAAIERLVRERVELTPAQRRVFLNRVNRPDLPGLLELIEAELKSPESGGFGQYRIHALLLPDQLDALAQRLPALYENHAFVVARLCKLLPNADADLEFDPVERKAWLERIRSYSKNLAPSFNTLKAHILYLCLLDDRTRGVYDKALFIEYLRLPRKAPYVRPEYVNRPGQAEALADLNADLSATYRGPGPDGFPQVELSGAIPGVTPIRNDEWLVREFLLELLKNESSWEPYSVYLRENYVKALFAEAKILHGIDAPEKWASLLTPAAFQALRDRVDIDFAPNNPRFHAPAEEVTVSALIKNAPKLIVKIYEINTLSYFLTHPRQPLNTDLQLDGLVANVERTEEYNDSPLRRIARTFTFPELKGRRGAWIIEFIGGGKSSRTLIRKGEWHLLQQTGAAGEMFTVVDEDQKPVPNAVAWFEGRKFEPDEKSGRIIIPFGAEGGTKPVILADASGEFATLTNFEHHAEEYRLEARFHIEREQLLAGREATVAVRVALLLSESSIELSPALLLEPKLTLTSTTHDGITTTSEVKIPAFDPAKLFTHSFRVPDRLAKLSISLRAQVEIIRAGGEKTELSASQEWDVNAIDKSKWINDGAFARVESGYLFDLFGKNGEPIADKQVIFEFTHLEFFRPLHVALRTDQNGRINLGALAEIRRVDASIAGLKKRSLIPWRDRIEGPRSIHAKAGTLIEVPWPNDAGPLTTEKAFLLEHRGNTYVADWFNAMSLANGFIQIKGLAPGDYALRIGHDRDYRDLIQIKVTAGVPVLNWLVSPSRILEICNPAPLQIESIREEAEAYVVQLRNANPWTRVNVSATRFYPHPSWGFGLAPFDPRLPSLRIPARRPNLFVAGRKIGDEYRYILERRYAKIFPGNMLTRPGLLLHPWELRSTDLEGQSMDGGEKAKAAAGDRDVKRGNEVVGRASELTNQAEDLTSEANLDFLATAAPTVYNLVPDEHGVVRIERKWLGDRQQIRICANDLTSATYRSIVLPQTIARFQDLRLTRNLDPAKHFSERKQIAVLAAGETLTLNDMLTSELQTYDSLAGIHALFSTLSQNSNLAAFAWILEWPSLKEEEKRAKYSEFACHELNFFLSHKDPAFFKAVIQPYLLNKKEKTFLDEWLLGNDLRRYLEPWNFARLNMAERALLSQRIPGEQAATVRHLRERYDLLPPNPEEWDRLFETALRGRAMQEEVAEALQVERRMLSEQIAEAPGTVAPAAAVMMAPAAPAPKALMRRAESLAAGAEGSLGRGVENDYSFFDALSAEDAVRLRNQARPFYRKLGPTKEWAENNYYHLPIAQQNADLIPINAFWRDYAAWDGKTPFLSQHVAQASRNFPEMMLALAVLDLPFESPKHPTRIEQKQFTLTAAGPLIVFHKEIEPVGAAPQESGLLVSENFFRHDERERREGNEKFAKYVTDEFLSGVVYGADVVVTNASVSPQKVSVLLQIPKHALPVLGSKATGSKQLNLEPYTTQKLEYFFYFPSPEPEPLPHYPVHVSRDELAVGSARPFEFKVVRQFSKVDATSWDYVSQYGTEEEVFAFLGKENIEQLDLERIAWRARENAGFWRKLIVLLQSRHLYNNVLYSYAVLHNDPAILGEWLRHQDAFVAQAGPWLESTLLKIDPIERRAYEHLEYSPLVNQRIHRVGAENRIPNPIQRAQYQALLRILAHKRLLEPMDQMSVVYHLFLQDRVEEALARFRAIAPEPLPTRLQYDYFRCYAAFYEENLPEALTTASAYLEYPVERWRKLFGDVASQLREIGGAAAPAPHSDQPDREAQQADLAKSEPTFDFQVENRTILLSWQNLREVTINYYRMDPEFLFSSSPFVTQDPGRFSIIKPGRSARQLLPGDKDSMEVPLPEEFARANVLVEILGAGQRKAQAYHANTLRVTMAENYGRLELRDQEANKPISKAYIKVYARLWNGHTRFFKDGYTDMRGRFDYASLNSSEHQAPPIPSPRPLQQGDGTSIDTQMLQPGELDEVEKFAILILSEKNGTAIREADTPSE